ncbi:MAG: hypothetical protein AB7S44_00320 [Spirochaetales bacterium]
MVVVEFFNLPYFFFIFLTAGIIVGLYFLLKNKSTKTKNIVLFSLLAFNLALHFLKVTFPPYSDNFLKAIRDIGFINICAVSVLTFPFFYLSKNKYSKDFMFYLGVISGFLALVIPTEALGENVLTLDNIRFYVCHMIIIIAPLLMVLLKVHTIDYKRIWKMPFYATAVMLFIICNQVLQSELGIVSLRGSDILAIGYTNPSLIWGPNDDLAILFSIFTPDFMKTIPFGAYAGQEKYWPLFWILPGVFVYFLVLPLLISLPWQLKDIRRDIKTLFSKLFTKKQAI